MREFKFFVGYVENNPFEDYFIPVRRRRAGMNILQDLVPVQPMEEPRGNLFHLIRNPPNGAMGLRDVAVIASSIQNFNNWRNETFDRNSICIITNRDFTYNEENNQTTRYTAITTINDCRGYTFDDYILTDRIYDILSSVYDETINHIHQLIYEVGINLRDNENI